MLTNSNSVALRAAKLFCFAMFLAMIIAPVYAFFKVNPTGFYWFDTYIMFFVSFGIFMAMMFALYEIGSFFEHFCKLNVSDKVYFNPTSYSEYWAERRVEVWHALTKRSPKPEFGGQNDISYFRFPFFFRF